MEACGSAHFWARELSRLGHQVRLLNPQFVKPYRRGHKNDHNDARAIAEAAAAPQMRFVAPKTVEQQSELVVHRVRALLAEHRKALMNSLRGLLVEFGIVAAQGAGPLREALGAVLEDGENGLSAEAREAFAEGYERLLDMDTRLARYDQRITAMARRNEAAKRLMTLSGVGRITATALLATVGDVAQFTCSREFAAWLGLVPRHFATGGRTRYGRITKRGDVYVRTLLVHGARSALRTAHRRDDALAHWALSVKDRRGANKAAVALAAKHARIIWALLSRQQNYHPRPLAHAAPL